MKYILFFLLFSLTTSAQSLFLSVGGSAYDNGNTIPSGLTVKVGFMLNDKSHYQGNPYKEGIVWYGSIAYESYREESYICQYVYSGGFGGRITEKAVVTVGPSYRSARNGSDGQLGFAGNVYLDLLKLDHFYLVANAGLGVTNMVQWTGLIGAGYAF